VTEEEIERALSAFLITVAVAAAILAVSKFQIYHLIRQERLEAVNLGADNTPYYRIKSESVRRLFEEMYRD